MKFTNQAATGSINSSNLTPEQAADFLNVSVKTLAKWRCQGHPNLPYSKIGRSVRYNLDELKAYIAKHSFNCVGE